MDEKNWKKLYKDCLEQMEKHVEPFITSIWKYRNEDVSDLKLHGSGSFFENSNGKFIITNQHVAKYFGNFRLTHTFKGSEDIIILKNAFIADPAPIDVAISKIDDKLWLQRKCESEAIHWNRFAKKHSSVEGELLFFIGFSGERSKVTFNNCFSRATSYLTQERPIPNSVDEADEDYHISIPYPPEQVEASDPSIPLPNPHGFSGSLLWNTKRVECMQKNIEWTPEKSEVTAIIWGWPSSTVCILATKIEKTNLEELTLEYSRNEGHLINQ